MSKSSGLFDGMFAGLNTLFRPGGAQHYARAQLVDTLKRRQAVLRAAAPRGITDPPPIQVAEQDRPDFDDWAMRSIWLEWQAAALTLGLDPDHLVHGRMGFIHLQPHHAALRLTFDKRVTTLTSATRARVLNCTPREVVDWFRDHLVPVDQALADAVARHHSPRTELLPIGWTVCARS